ncbi:MAG: hypothetical protein AAF206_24180, partial [Bacteroidota bacterium]
MRPFSIILLLFVFWVPQKSVAQSARVIDSLHVLLQDPIQDSVLADVHSDLYFEWFAHDSDSALTHLMQSIGAGQRAGDIRRLGRGYLNLANFRWRQGSFLASREALVSVAKLLPEINRPVYDATYHIESGILHFEIAAFDSAIYHYLRAKDLYL